MVYPGGENFTHRHIRRGEGGFDQTWSPRGFDIKVNCVCVRCNGEWMERLRNPVSLDLAFSLGLNHYQGRTTMQLELLDIISQSPSEPRP